MSLKLLTESLSLPYDQDFAGEMEDRQARHRKAFGSQRHTPLESSEITPFVDGNKRPALVLSLTFLDRNGWDIVT